MNKYQKQVQRALLNNEKAIIKILEECYSQALNDIMAKITELQARTDTQNLQSIIYQLDYQKALKTQISAILDQLHTNEFNSINDYLIKCYEDSFIGTLYDLQAQGVPLLFPINQDQVVKAITLNTKLSKPLYDTLGIDIKELKRLIRAEISRGISQNYSYETIARNLKNSSGNSYNNSIRIARTEGHRISGEATQAMYPGGFGIASEDINCRCVSLQRAKWALSDEEFTKMNGETNELVHFKNLNDYEEFKSKFWKWGENK